MRKELLVELLASAELGDVFEISSEKFINIDLEDNDCGIGATDMRSNGDITFFTQSAPLHPNWFVYNLKDLATEKELPKLYEALTKLK